MGGGWDQYDRDHSRYYATDLEEDEPVSEKELELDLSEMPEPEQSPDRVSAWEHMDDAATSLEAIRRWLTEVMNRLSEASVEECARAEKVPTDQGGAKWSGRFALLQIRVQDARRLLCLAEEDLLAATNHVAKAAASAIK